MRILLLVLTLFLVVPVFGQRNKKTEETGTPVTLANTGGIIYSLPRTGLRVYVTATRTDLIPGPYAKFADPLLGISDARAEPGSKWKLDQVEIETFSEPDPAQVFRATGSSAALVGLASDGCLSSVNSATSNEKELKNITNPVSYPGVNEVFQFTDLSDLSFYNTGDSANKFRSSRLSLEQKAAQAASRILDCRKIKFEMAAGFLDELPADGKAYEESLKQLDKIEAGYTTLFAGVNQSESFTFSFEFVPVSDLKGEVLFRFSEQKGVLEKTDLTGKPVMLEVLKDNGLSGSIDRLNSQIAGGSEGGVYYRIPGLAEIKLIYELKALVTLRSAVAQFGAVAPVPEMYLDGNYSLEFHLETGAIKNIIKK